MRQVLSLALFLVLVAHVSVGATERQQDTMFLQDTFCWVPGAWAEYHLVRGSTSTPLRFRMAITELDTSSVPAKAWVEVGIGPTNGAMIITRMKLEANDSGPGDPLEAIMQLPGSDPIAVPRKHLKSGKASGTRALRWTCTSAQPAWSNMTWLGQEITVAEMTATNSTGARSTVFVSSNVPPLCIVSASATNMEMRMVAWGGNATSSIAGKPVGLLRWIWRQIRGRRRRNSDTTDK